jgi:hypothetical protein
MPGKVPCSFLSSDIEVVRNRGYSLRTGNVAKLDRPGAIGGLHVDFGVDLCDNGLRTRWASAKASLTWVAREAEMPTALKDLPLGIALMMGVSISRAVTVE